MTDRTPCLHCSDNAAVHGCRGLCRRCHCNLGIRAQYDRLAPRWVQEMTDAEILAMPLSNGLFEVPGYNGD